MIMVFSFMAVAFVGFLFGIIIGGACMVRDVREDAIRHGVGKYYINHLHKKKFTWVVR